MVKRLFRLTPSEIRMLPSYDDQNFYVAATEGGEYVLKIMNSEDSKNCALVEVQTYAMSFLHQNGLPAQTALPTTSGQLMSLEEIGMRPVTQFIRKMPSNMPVRLEVDATRHIQNFASVLCR